LHAVDVFVKLGAMKELEFCRCVLCCIEEAINRVQTPHESDVNDELMQVVPISHAH